MIEIHGVHKRYGDTVAVEDLSLSLPPGEMFGFLGPNGAGKTTTIKMMVGLLRPTRGRIAIAGHDIVGEPEAAKRHIGYIPDNPYIYEKLSGREFLEFVGHLFELDRGTIAERIEWLFDLFAVDGWGDARAESYSHGMRQKIVMASAFIHKPTAIIVDEPMVGLDPQSTRLVKDMLRLQVRSGATVFMSTHSLDVAEELCDRIGIIHGGRLIALGTQSELEQRAQHRGVGLEELFLGLTGGTREAWLI